MDTHLLPLEHLEADPVRTMMQVDPRRQFPRKFVPADADMGDWAQIEPLFTQLLERPIDSVDALEQALLDSSELASALAEEHAMRYIAMTTQTDDPAREQAYKAFVEEIEPKTKPLWFALQVAYLGNPYRKMLPMDRYAVMDRIIENDVALFREENVPLETQDALAAKDYQKVSGAMTITCQGQELTLQQAAKYFEEPDRRVRQEVWELVARRRLQDRETLEELYDRLIGLRTQIGENSGFDNFRDYAFKKRRRFDYAPEHCRQFHRGVERGVLPLVNRIYADRVRKLGVPALRPWDALVDPLGRPPLRPFQTAEELVRGCEEIFRRIDPALGEQFKFMRDEQLLDLESRKGKAPGGYMSPLEERRWAFIFMNAVGRDDDVRTLLHEGGHAFHQLAAREQPLMLYRSSPYEFSEVASMGMELLAIPHLDVFYSTPEDNTRAYRDKLEDGILLFPWIATIDSFQHWVYTHPGHSRDERRRAWVEIYTRFQPAFDWSGYDEARDYLWHRQPHLYTDPFYYIEYGIAQVGALQVWLQSRSNHRAAVERYWRALALGGSRPLPRLFEAAGARFGFDYETLRPLADAVGEELDRLGD